MRFSHIPLPARAGELIKPGWSFLLCSVRDHRVTKRSTVPEHMNLGPKHGDGFGYLSPVWFRDSWKGSVN